VGNSVYCGGKMISIKKTVGLKASNHYEDVKKVQILLNQNRHLSGYPEIDDDSSIGPKTIAAIKSFQRKVIEFSNPDGRVDPDGKTIASLNEGAIVGNKPVAPPPKQVTPPSSPSQKNIQNITLQFPLKRRPGYSYKKGARFYGAKRKGGRLHAGCDLIAPVGTKIYAVADGVIHKYKNFYHQTHALVVIHTGGFVVRYGEVSPSGLAPGLKVGSKVKSGQFIAYVGQLSGGSHMLHFELYTGTESGKLTVRSNKPYQRRADLVDPTNYLDNASLP